MRILETKMGKIVYTFYAVLFTSFLYATEGVQYRPCLPEFECVNHKDCSFYVQVPNPPPYGHYGSFAIESSYYCGFDDANPNIQKVCCPKRPITKQVENIFETQDMTMVKEAPKSCGSVNVKPRIIGDYSHNEPGEFPWMAIIALETDTPHQFKLKCGATLIGDRHVLTAAHCVLQKIAFVRLGEFNVATEQDCDETGRCQPPVQDLPVMKVSIHPDFDPQTLQNDIALVRLAVPVTLSRSVQPICLPVDSLMETRINVGDKLIAAGWGSMKGILNKIALPVLPLKSCAKMYTQHGMSVSDRQICAGGNTGMDTCDGDSGGPLQRIRTINGVAKYVITGLISYGPIECGLQNYPGVYINVQTYLPWIFAALSENNIAFA